MTFLLLLIQTKQKVTLWSFNLQAMVVKPGDNIGQDTEDYFVWFAFQQRMKGIFIQNYLLVWTFGFLVKLSAHWWVCHSISLSV